MTAEMTPPSETPRVDALLLQVNEGRVYDTNGPVAELARTLEREVIALREKSQFDDAVIKELLPYQDEAVAAVRLREALRLAGERVSGALAWIDARRQRLHAEDCSVHEPSAQCSCGLHRVLTDLRAVINSADALSTPQGDTKGNANG